ncbi:unnamed protein product [Darwinula stevensoni]|uniref:Lipoma HMGIC fusion partner-like 3 protein n=1 Tax=Darwinula stevensoni TaxID=69355 RepID=A0A7R9A0I5_9CRUS|nr:unnamed protein product [Darwinula stevensoni]CAG0881193.1 unnamed protein product [Darwinula stevensoni]
MRRGQPNSKREVVPDGAPPGSVAAAGPRERRGGMARESGRRRRALEDGEGMEFVSPHHAIPRVKTRPLECGWPDAETIGRRRRGRRGMEAVGAHGRPADYVEASYATNYVRNSKAIAVLWGVFTICFAIISVVVFVQPQWIGDTASSRGIGYFGLWQHCTVSHDGQTLACRGRLQDFASILSPAFRAATVFTGLSVLITFLCICAMLLFFFVRSSTVFHICGWMQVFSGACLAVGVLSFPAGWDAAEIREVCGPHAGDFKLGECGFRWAYVLALIGLCDVIVLASLAFLLATRYIKVFSHPDPLYGSIYKGEVNSGYLMDNRSLAGSHKSLGPLGPNLGPVMMVPGLEADRFSEFSHRTGRSKYSSAHNLHM